MTVLLAGGRPPCAPRERGVERPPRHLRWGAAKTAPPRGGIGEGAVVSLAGAVHPTAPSCNSAGAPNVLVPVSSHGLGEQQDEAANDRDRGADPEHEPLRRR